VIPSATTPVSAYEALEQIDADATAVQVQVIFETWSPKGHLMNSRIACSTYGYRFLSLEAALERIAANGFSTVDLIGSRPHLLPEDYSEDELRALKEKIEGLGLRVSAITAFDGHPFWHFTAANQRHREATVQHVNSCIDVAAFLGAPVVQAITGMPIAQDVQFETRGDGRATACIGAPSTASIRACGWP
jgi:sugar phosphate isomerase/epimerase